MKQLADRTCPTCGAAVVELRYSCGASTRRESAVAVRTSPCGSSAPGYGGAVQQDLPLSREEQAAEAGRRG